MSKKVLFISHDASRTGAPFVLLHLLRWLRENSTMEFEILLRNGGELEGEFREVATTHIWNLPIESQFKHGKIKKYIKKILFRKKVHKTELLTMLSKKKFDLVFANSVASCDAILEIKDRLMDIPVICYLHELEISIIQFCGLDVFNHASKVIDHYIGSSKMVVENLKKKHGISDSRLDLVHDYIPAKSYFKDKNKFNKKQIKGLLGIPEDAFVVGASGTLDWRKGVDLFSQIARIVKEQAILPVYFLWNGGQLEGVEYDKLMYDIDKLDVKDRVFFVEYKMDYFAAIDVFLLTSREDPFPLVCLQAASFAKPVICFESAGGMPEFVEEDCGFVVPYLRTELVAQKIMYLAENRELSEKLGANSARKVMEKYDVEIAAKRLLSIMDKIIYK